MIRDLDQTISAMLTTEAPVGSELAAADITFDLPDSKWRSGVTKLTVNCYLYDIRENHELRTAELVLRRSADGKRAGRLRPPVRVDCSYCITAWSVATTDAVLEEHRVLSQVLQVLVRNWTIPVADLVGSMTNQPAPYPSIVASPEATKNLPDFWRALDQQLKPSLNYVVTIATWPDPVPPDAALARVVDTYVVTTANLDELP